MTTWLLASLRSGRYFLVLCFIAALTGVLLAAQPAHPDADVTHYKYWARLVTTQGMAAMYSGEYPETYVIYPPVTMYGLALVGHVYQAAIDPSFDREQALASAWLTLAVRLMALGMHLATGIVLFVFLSRAASPWQATAGAGLYLLNPGALWDVAVWGQPDSWHALFALLGIWLLVAHPFSGGAWLALAAMAKPQAWVLLPLAGAAVLRRAGPRGAARALAGGGLVVLLVSLPFLLAGRLREALTLPGQISSVMPVASANAHNLWWLATAGASPFVFDNERLGGPFALTYRQAALVLLLAALAFTLWRAWSARGPWELAALSAYSVHAWFSLTTAAHENHPFMIFPFLCLVAWRDRFLMAVLLVLMATFSFNVLAHDGALAQQVRAWLGSATLEPGLLAYAAAETTPLEAAQTTLDAEFLRRWSWRLQMAASAVNLLVLAAWTAWLLRPRGGAAGTREAADLP